ncbi:MAG: hypothetical protein A2X22_11455 [Bacteroidetes bacterium GWF2_49_14]|nr:MAG: hypothetical protein A2X22_11455 [Bacteroidetes bacterium GWF2_49_14]HBB90732.1 GNAT family N-acetyltransferase [Bacteroidales bacterium]
MEPLIGKLIKLRAIEPADEDLLFRWENDTLNWQVSNTFAPFSRRILKQYLEQAHLDIFQSRQLRLVIETAEPLKPVGMIDLFDYDPFHQRAGIGILIGDPDQRGKGYALDALHALNRYAFKVLMLRQVFCSIDETNQISLSLFQKAGFRITGRKEQWNRGSEGWTDEWFLQITYTDWAAIAE